MYDRMLDIDEGDAKLVLSKWSESSRLWEPGADAENEQASELSRNLISPDVKKEISSSVGFDTFNPSKKQESQAHLEQQMSSVHEEGAKAGSSVYMTLEQDPAKGTQPVRNGAGMYRNGQFRSECGTGGLQRMPTLATELIRERASPRRPKWKQNLLNMRKRKERRRRLHEKGRRRSKKPLTKKHRQRRLRQKKLRKKLKIKKMLKSYLAKFPWKNKKHFDIRRRALHRMKKYGTLPGALLHQRKSRAHLAPEVYYADWKDRSREMWPIRGSPVIKRDIFRSASVGGHAGLHRRPPTPGERPTRG